MIRAWFSQSNGRRRAIGAAVLGGLVVLSCVAFATLRRPREAKADHHKAAAVVPASLPAPTALNHVELGEDQRNAIGLKVEPVSAGTHQAMVRAPGQIVPDETRYAYITPRAAGVVRFVSAHEGQQVKTGDLLAMIDSPDLAQARFDLYTQLQEEEISRSQANWQEVVYKNTLALLERLEAGDSPDEIDRQFEDRPVGSNREQLIRAYAAQRLAKATYDRNLDLYNQKVIPAKQFQQVRAEYESAEAAYQSLTEQMRYSAKLLNTQSQQALRKAETAVRVARARLRMLGVSPDGSISEVKDGKVVGVNPDGTLSVASEPAASPVLKPDGTAKPTGAPAANEPEKGNATAPVEPIGAHTAGDPIAGMAGRTPSADRPVSSYPIWAPFDGTVIDRMMIVPGVYVDTTHRIFTLADLSTVWVEVHVHESNYAAIVKGRNAKVRFTSPAYPGQTFEAEVLYSGDLVDAKTRTLRLMARAQNPDRRLKPGMFVDAEIAIPEGISVMLVPSAAVLTEEQGALVFVQTGADRFERREIQLGTNRGEMTEVVSGLKPGDSVVTAGAFKLKARLHLDREEAPAVAADTAHGEATE